jgi:hypothetical protein
MSIERETFLDLLEKCLEGTASAAEEGRVVAAAESDSDLRALLEEALLLDARMRALRHADVDLSSKAVKALRRKGSSGRFATAMRRQIERGGPGGGPGGRRKSGRRGGSSARFKRVRRRRRGAVPWVFWGAGAVAAAAAVALIFYLIAGREEPAGGMPQTPRIVRTPQPPEPEPDPEKPVAPEPPEPPAPPEKTGQMLAEVVEFRGKAVELTGGAAGRKLKKGLVLRPGDGLRTPRVGSAKLRYPDGTEVSLVGSSEVRLVDGRGAKHIAVVRGRLSFDVARQPKERPLIINPGKYDQAEVVGTRFSYSKHVGMPASSERTTLIVFEGEVVFGHGEGRASVTAGLCSEVKPGKKPTTPTDPGAA